MITIKYVRENKEKIIESLKRRHKTELADIEKLLNLDIERRKLIEETEKYKAERNRASKEIGIKKRNKENADDIIKEMKIISKKIGENDEKLLNINAEIERDILNIPCILDESVKEGLDETDNIEIKKWGSPKEYGFEPREHWELARIHKLIDFERAAKLSGARFAIYSGLGAQLERALINFMLDVHTKEHNYKEILPPFLVLDKVLQGTGQLPKFEEDLFKIKNSDLYLIPTAEVPLTNIHREEILDSDLLPLYYTAYTPCFRAEAGSYGKDVKGLIRQHQFNKVELVKIVRPENSADELEKLLADAEKILQLLELPYRVVLLCSGDTGFSAAKTYDIEVWLPGQNRYREISSCSNCIDFQARRADIKFRDKHARKAEYAHTLNGSGLAVGRCWAAIIENYQQKDGSIIIPDALRPYLNNLEIIN